MVPSGQGPGDAEFRGSIPDVYDRLLVPMIFRAAATRKAGTVAAGSPGEILETAAGTGVLTHALSLACPAATIVATDLNQPMLDTAATRLPQFTGVTWRQADAVDLPFGDESFDVVVCQFGVMFFTDRVRGHEEALRVLRPFGSLHFSVWDRIENNEVPHLITTALAARTPSEPLTFMRRVPHGSLDHDVIRQDLEQAGFGTVRITSVDGTSTSTAAEAAVAFCQGTPFRGEIERHPTLHVDEATAIAEQALRDRWGSGRFTTAIRSFEVSATR